MKGYVINENQLSRGVFTYRWTLTATDKNTFIFVMGVKSDTEKEAKKINETELYFKPHATQLIVAAALIADMHYAPSAKKKEKAVKKDKG